MKILNASFPLSSADNVRFNSGPEVNVVFLGRLRKYAEDILHRNLILTVGYRSTEKQAELYQKYVDGVSPTVAAKPGTSWHEFCMAVDVDGASSAWPEIYSDYQKPVGQQRMNQYGLCIPMNITASTHEWWHIQPIETSPGPASVDRCWFPDTDDYCNSQSGYRTLKLVPSCFMKGSDVRVMQDALAIKADGVFGNDTLNALIAFQSANGLAADGVCGSATWKILLTPPVEIDWQEECKKKDEEILALESELASLESELSKTKDALVVAEATATQKQGAIDAYNKALAELK